MFTIGGNSTNSTIKTNFGTVQNMVFKTTFGQSQRRYLIEGSLGVGKGKLKKVREKSRECHNHKSQPLSDTKRKRKQTKPKKRKSNKRTKSTKISSLFPKRGNRNAKRTEKHKNKITQCKT